MFSRISSSSSRWLFRLLPALLLLASSQLFAHTRAQQNAGRPRILPMAAADSYPEGASINLICTVSGGQRGGLELTWSRQGEPLDSSTLPGLSISGDDADISILRIRNASQAHSGRYTCLARNPLGQDSSSVDLVINVELKWSKVPKDVEVALGQEVAVECDAIGSPSPTIDWVRHASDSRQPAASNNGTTFVARARLLKIARAKLSDSGLYECIARNGLDQDLRRIIQVKVRGKFQLPA